MNCIMIEELIIRYLEKDLDMYKKYKFKRHMLLCKKCRERFHIIKKNYDPTLEVIQPSNLKYSIMKKINLLDEADKKYSNASIINYEINGSTLDKNHNIQLNNLSRLVPIVAGGVQILLVISLFLFAPYIAAKINSHNLPFSNTQIKVNQPKLKSYSLTIILNDNYSNDKEASQIRDHVVTIKDINSVISILRSAGYDNISVNDIRLSKDTGVVAYGQFVQIENKKLIAPYIIRSSGIFSNSVDQVINDKTINELKLRGVVEKIEKQEDIKN